MWTTHSHSTHFWSTLFAPSRAECLTPTTSRPPRNSPRRCGLVSSHFPEKETETLGGKVTCSGHTAISDRSGIRILGRVATNFNHQAGPHLIEWKTRSQLPGGRMLLRRAGDTGMTHSWDLKKPRRGGPRSRGGKRVLPKSGAGPCDPSCPFSPSPLSLHTAPCTVWN